MRANGMAQRQRRGGQDSLAIIVLFLAGKASSTFRTPAGSTSASCWAAPEVRSQDPCS